jgi:hypothetical protein
MANQTKIPLFFGNSINKKFKGEENEAERALD